MNIGSNRRNLIQITPLSGEVWALFNVEGARHTFEKALESDRNDARILYERDQLWKRIRLDARIRIAELESRPELVERRATI